MIRTCDANDDQHQGPGPAPYGDNYRWKHGGAT
eukprot:CAMPEP_0194430296 /NCGR_PEP_ID=MMETSP0176-20130528/54103_1 /TAXON_ID=216777 /ORGANISM="Proboscia alata, Strain PI-D3" /LENGTH=32 /DNA_ID= /DNA_START= /DNA_END= /DNA_ORIENTATION=